MEVQPVSERRLWLVWSVGKGKTVDRRGVEKKQKLMESRRKEPKEAKVVENKKKGGKERREMRSSVEGRQRAVL